MYIEIQKHHARYITALIKKRMIVIKNRILKEKKDDWYDYESSQIESKICDISDEYYRLSQIINDLYKIN